MQTSQNTSVSQMWPVDCQFMEKFYVCCWFLTEALVTINWVEGALMSPWERVTESEISRNYDTGNEGQMPSHWSPSMSKSLLKRSWLCGNQTPAKKTPGRQMLKPARPGALPVFVYHCVPRISKEVQQWKVLNKYMLTECGQLHGTNLKPVSAEGQHVW